MGFIYTSLLRKEVIPMSEHFYFFTVRYTDGTWKWMYSRYEVDPIQILFQLREENKNVRSVEMGWC